MESSQVILKPVMTEKSFIDAAKGEYTFFVNPTASKKEIARAVKELFKVDVKGVKTLIIKGRSKRVFKRRERTKVSPIKKAVVRVGKEQKIDIFEIKTQ
jgi:large subunit ribosomal protein L23